MVDACPANGGVLAQRVLRFCEIEVSNRPPRSNWSTLGIQPSLGIPIWLFLHIPFLVLLLSYSAIWYDRHKGLWCCGNRDSAIEGSPAHCRMQKGASKHPISSRRARFWSYQAAERRSLPLSSLKLVLCGSSNILHIFGHARAWVGIRLCLGSRGWSPFHTIFLCETVGCWELFPLCTCWIQVVPSRLGSSSDYLFMNCEASVLEIQITSCYFRAPLSDTLMKHESSWLKESHK